MNANIPPGLERVILKCLSKRPDTRYPRYEALAEDLRPYGPDADAPAAIGPRLLAGSIDMAVATLPWIVPFFWMPSEIRGS